MIKSEMRRILRSWYYWLIVGLAWFAVSVSLAVLAFSGLWFSGPSTAVGLQRDFLALIGGSVMPLYVVLAGVVVTRDFGSRYIYNLSLYCGSRVRLMFYKGVALLVPVSIMILMNVVLVVAGLYVESALFGFPINYGDGHSWWLLLAGTGLLYLSVYFGYFLGWLFRSSVLFSLVWLLWVYLLEPVASFGLHNTGIRDWPGVLPGAAVQGAVGRISGFYDWVYFLIFCGWSILAFIFGVWRTMRRSLA